ncbi:MAG: hypothetical protein ACJATN_001767 [Neolewinella sp.]|jgi:hypothetical protein
MLVLEEYSVRFCYRKQLTPYTKTYTKQMMKA